MSCADSSPEVAGTGAGLVGVILAAGAGNRLGYPKAALHLGQRFILPMLVTALRQGGASKVLVVLSTPAEQSISGLPALGCDEVVINPAPESGRTGSVHCALSTIPQDCSGLLIHPCDVPLLSHQVVEELIKAWRNCESPTQTVVRPITPAGNGGHPLLIPCGRFAHLAAMGPDQALRELLIPRENRLDVTIRGDPGPFLGINTPDQLELLESFISKSK